MAQLAFLATMLSPRIAAAAAQRALEVGALTGVCVHAQPRSTKCCDMQLQSIEACGFQVLSEADGVSHDSGIGESLPDQPWSASVMQDAAAAAMCAAALKAKLMADAEERDIQRTVAEVRVV